MFWKRLLCALLAAVMLLAGTGLAEEMIEDDDFEIVDEDEAGEAAEEEEAAAPAEPTTLDIALGGRIIPDEPTHITVANSTKVDGNFFTRQFGTNTSDIDVRAMIQGYNPIVWDTQVTFVVDEQVVKNLSESTNSQGDKVYTFTLWDDLKWNDGSPITAADYVFGYVLQGSPEFEQISKEYTTVNHDSGDTDVWKHVVGFEEFLAGDTPYFSGIRLLDKYRYSVTVKKEYLPYFYEYTYVYIMPSPISVVAPGCEVADDGKGAYIRNIDKTIEEPIFTTELLRETVLDPETGYLSHPYLTCGPYSLTEYNAEEGRVEFTINEYFKGNYQGVKPVINNVTLVPVLPQEMSEKLANHEIDLINKVVDGAVINELRGLMVDPGGVALSNYARLGYAYFGLACEQGPQQFKKVRQAINYAFDSDGYVRDFLLGYGLNVYGFYGIGQWMTQAAMGNLRPENLTEEQEAIWDSFTLDELNTYAYDAEHPSDRPLKLLIEDGWVLNEKGEPFDPEVDDIRYKKLEDKEVNGEIIEGELMRLSFDFGLIAEDIAAQMALERLRNVMEPIGAEFIIHEEPFRVILTDHQNEEGKLERDYDIIFMAYNFNSIFDPLVELFSATEDQIVSENVTNLATPAPTATPAPEEIDPERKFAGSQNSTGIYDEELMQLCWDLHYTEPGDVQSFETKWIEFQKRFNEILPTVPIYSNVYFDFYSNWLHNYDPASEPNWPRALLYSYWSEPVVEEEPVEEGEELTEEGEEFSEEDLGDDEMIILD